MKRVTRGTLALATVLAFGACSQDAAAPANHVVEGHAALTTFTTAPSSVRVMQNGTEVASSQVAADGFFKLAVPPGADYSIEFVSSAGPVTMVFPRSAGTVDHKFVVRGPGAPFNLGQVRYIGDPSAASFAFKTQTSALESADDDNLECEDGVDAATGAICVDDDDEEGAGVCDDEEGNDEEGDEEEDGDDIDCEDGLDPNGVVCEDGADEADGDADTDDIECEDGLDPNGAVCEDGADDDGDEAGTEEDGDDIECEDGVDPNGAPCEDGADDDEEEDGQDAAVHEASVPEHNLPATLGCEDSGADFEGEQEGEH